MGIFNENLRRSFERLDADKSDMNARAAQQVRLVQRPHPIKPGKIILVNTSSEEEQEDRKVSLNKKYLRRDSKTRAAIKRGSRQLIVRQNSSSSSAYGSEKSERQETERNNQLELIMKDNNILSLTKELNFVKGKLQQCDFDNKRLKEENSLLSEKLLSYSILTSRLESELQFSKSQGTEMTFLINKLNTIVQNQDQEIAELKEQNKSVRKSVCHGCGENQNRNIRKASILSVNYRPYILHICYCYLLLVICTINKGRFQ